MGCCLCYSRSTDEVAIDEPLLGDDDGVVSVNSHRKKEPSLEEIKWYHGGITHLQAEHRLRSVNRIKNGTYLVYHDPDAASHEQVYVLLVYKNGVYHRLWLVRRTDGYILRDLPNDRSHNSVQQLIRYHRGVLGKSIILPEDEGRIILKDYVYV